MHYYVHSFADLDPGEYDNEDIWNIWLPGSNINYPDIAKLPLWKQVRQQKIASVNFWYLLQHHAFSLYTF